MFSSTGYRTDLNKNRHYKERT